MFVSKGLLKNVCVSKMKTASNTKIVPWTTVVESIYGKEKGAEMSKSMMETAKKEEKVQKFESFDDTMKEETKKDQ